ncbi:MAG: tetratricopeptide repeat protein, partial [Candidatus Aminicenantes bacterium]|nr:tetratricopeptide repeat protein [Candidatus Aminicenantes bacterium]NIM80756.1 tetratricopeptide repeat protein [Candidatus Aminicenantes bacterium]NIN20131.1 tetratricopeptide repeat protein [Candidatus Aminicenantes bacterium]NIN43918.1 tetratricopeptide repeat protein [Candidatus Aminicenantes bacterium]NIN86727.1 tetratricopeptide repeat protein [Candidatus Aminicenantes bacterium]
EGSTLVNMGNNFYAQRDFDAAIKYMEKGLKIFHEIGDKSHSIPTLHNMALIAYKNKDIEKFLEYETAAYKIAIE